MTRLVEEGIHTFLRALAEGIGEDGSIHVGVEGQRFDGDEQDGHQSWTVAVSGSVDGVAYSVDETAPTLIQALQHTWDALLAIGVAVPGFDQPRIERS